MRIKRTARVLLDDDRVILLSYGTAVAMASNYSNPEKTTYLVYSKRYSPTTARHVANFVGNNGIKLAGLDEWKAALLPYVFVDADKNTATE